MNERGLTIDSFRTIEDLHLLPYLTKEIIRDNIQDLIATNMNDRPVEFRTSGSTGKKLVFYGTDDLYKKEAAFILRAFRSHGATMYDKPSVWIRRYVPKNNNSPLWYYDHELRRLYMSAYNINSDTIKDYVTEINRKKYHTLVGYPSSIYIFACMCEESGLYPAGIEAIHVASEKMLDKWKDKIEEVFGIIPKAHYGMQEKVVLHHQTSHSTAYIENFEYGITEFDNTEGQNVIVGTGFLNYYMPFIRYRTSDVGILNPDGAPYRMLDIDGRCDDILVSKNGARLPGVNFYTMMYKIDGVKMFQIIQKTRETIEFLLVPNEHYTEETILEITTGLKQRLGNLDISVQVVEKIKRSHDTGKIRCIFNECES